MVRMKLILLAALPLSACMLAPPNHFGGLSASVSAEDYARRLCAHQALNAYPSCVSAVLEEMDRPRPDPPPPGHSTSGPFALILDGRLYLGTYQASPFRARFDVANGDERCRGHYDAFGGSADAIYDVHCTDGRKGWADLIRSHDGRNGIGRLMLDDGTQGDIVFGHVPLDGLFGNRQSANAPRQPADALF